MNIGIIGYGKMGQDIFSLLHDKMDDSKFTIICRHDIQQHTEKIIKKLDKDLRRKKISPTVYQQKKENFIITSELSNLADCDFVLESISENLQKKQQIFSEIEKVVSEKCILASNTSSLPLSKVFSETSHKNRCIGFHFFYPVKLSGFIEINVPKTASDSTVEFLTTLCNRINKENIVFNEPYHLYLNQFISFCISHGLLLLNDYNCSILNGTEIMTELFPLHGLFRMIDSIGLSLLTTRESDFSVERIKTILLYGNDKMQSWLNDGCSGMPGEFLQFAEKEDCSNTNDSFSKDDIVLSMISAVLNEAVYAANDATDSSETLITALTDAIGLANPMSLYYNQYGYDVIHEKLNNLYRRFGHDAYITAPKDLFEKYLNKKECD